MGIPIDMKEVPRDWRRTMTLFGLIGLGAGLAGAAYLGLRTLVREENKIAVKEVLEESVSKFKAAALDAAKEGANNAVRDTIGPLSNRINEVDRRIERHEVKDDERQMYTERRLDADERRLDRLERRSDR